MGFETWAKDSEGNISVRPLAGYDTAIFRKMAIGLRLEFLNPGDAPQKPSGHVQLALSPAGAAALAQALLHAAAQIDRSPGEGPKN